MQVFIDGVKVNDVQIKFADGTDAKAMKPFVHGVSNARVQTIATAGSGSLTISTTSAPRRFEPISISRRTDEKGPMGELVNASNGAGRHASHLARRITVGSYDFNDILYEPDKKWYSYKSATGDRMVLGSISGYSNAGYLRSNGNGKMLVKPDVVAPRRMAPVSPACLAAVARWTKRRLWARRDEALCDFQRDRPCDSIHRRRDRSLDAEEADALGRQVPHPDSAKCDA